MPSLIPQTSQSISVLLIEPDRESARKLQEWLFAHFQSTLDLASADSLRDGIAHLCTHRVSVILLTLALSDRHNLDPIRTLRRAAPDSRVIVYGSLVDETLRLAAIRAGAHDVLSMHTLTPNTFHSAVEAAIATVGRPRTEAGASPIRILAHDLNNAITSINGFADILLMRLPADEPLRVCAEQIKQAGTRAAALVKSLGPASESSPATQVVHPSDTAQAA